jgi:regulator of replication initiation timing
MKLHYGQLVFLKKLPGRHDNAMYAITTEHRLHVGFLSIVNKKKSFCTSTACPKNLILRCELNGVTVFPYDYVDQSRFNNFCESFRDEIKAAAANGALCTVFNDTKSNIPSDYIAISREMEKKNMILKAQLENLKEEYSVEKENLQFIIRGLNNDNTYLRDVCDNRDKHFKTLQAASNSWQAKQVELEKKIKDQEADFEQKVLTIVDQMFKLRDCNSKLAEDGARLRKENTEFRDYIACYKDMIIDKNAMIQKLQYESDMYYKHIRNDEEMKLRYQQELKIQQEVQKVPVKTSLCDTCQNATNHLLPTWKRILFRKPIRITCRFCVITACSDYKQVKYESKD